MENIKKERRYKRTQATKLLGKVELVKDLKEIIKLQVLKEQLEEKRLELKDLDKQVLILTVEENEEVEKDRETSEEYQEKILEAIKKIELNLNEREEENEKSEDALKILDIEEKRKPPTIAARLPKIDLPTFEGDITKWFSFWQIFDVNINQRKDLATIEKLSYLLSLLRGEPSRLVSSFAVTSENYSDIIQILQCQYGQKGKIVDLNVRKILDMKPVASVTQTSDLKNLITELSINLRNLKNLGIDTNDCSPILNTKIKQLIPSDLLLLYERQKGKEETTSTEDLVAFLQTEINYRENIKPILDPKAPIFRPRTPQWRPPIRQASTFLPRARFSQPRMWTPPLLPHQPFATRPQHHRESNTLPRIHRPGFSSAADKTKVICFKCGQAGHLARECQSG